MSRYLEDDEKEYIVIDVPKNTKKMKIKATLNDGRQALTKVKRKEIKRYREMYLELDPYDNAFDTYVFTEEGEEYLKRLEAIRERQDGINTVD